MPGVMAVATSEDFPIMESQVIDMGETMGNNRLLAENLLAHKKVLYTGHAVAGVAATNPHVAEEALKLIEVEYEELPPVLSVHDAMKKDAPLLYDEALTIRNTAERFGRGTDTGVVSNIGSHIQYKLGNVEQGFKEASVVIEREFDTKAVHQGYIEPHASTAFWASNGHLTIWTSTQSSFGVRAQIAAILGIPESTVKVIPMEIGGGFGAKIPTWLDPVAALLSRKSGHPVKMVMSRKEVFEATGPTSGTYMWIKMGANKNGRITAAQLYLAFEAGAFPGSPVGAAAGTALAPYKIDNQLVDGYDVVCNKPKVTPYRAPGSPQGAFAVEIAIDELAEKLGMDPLEFRLKNASKEGDRMSTGMQHGRIGCIETLEVMKANPHYNTPLEGPKPWPWSGHRLLVQQRHAILCNHQRQRQRHHQPDYGIR